MTKLDSLLQVLHKHVIFIQMHNYPDQDALASAWGLKTLLEHYGKNVVIFYKGHINKYNTIKMIELLHIDVVPADSIDFHEDDEIILVDCQKGNINVKDYIGDEVACIDHHKHSSITYLFEDIRPDVGACSSIITEYFIENQITIDKPLATALTYGIRIDTNNLSRSVSELDLDMYCYLYKLADKNILRKLDTCSLEIKDLKSYYQTISNLKIYRNVALANIGDNCSEALIGQVSDFLLTLKEVDFTIIHSYRDGGIKFSLRSESSSLDAADIIKKALQDYGKGDGGGHAEMAAGFIPDIKTKKAATVCSSAIEELILDIITKIISPSKKVDLTLKKTKYDIKQIKLD